MSLTCPRCGSQNTDNSKFCLSCGNDLRGLAPAAPSPPAAFGPPPAPPAGFGAPPQPPPGFGPPGQPPAGYGGPPQPPVGYGQPAQSPGFGSPAQAPAGFGPPPQAPQGYAPQAQMPSQGYGPPPQQNYGAPVQSYAPPQQQPAPQPPQQPVPSSQGASPDLSSYAEGLRTIAVELRGIAASKTIFSTQVLPSPIPGVAAVAIRYGRSMHVLCAGGPFAQPLWPSRDFSDRDRLLAATIGSSATAEQIVPWVLTYVLPGVFPDLGRDAQSQSAFLEAADAFGVGVDGAGIEAARRQGFPDIGRHHARFLVVSEPKQSVAGIELRWGDRPFEMLYVPTPGVVARAAPWT